MMTQENREAILRIKANLNQMIRELEFVAREIYYAKKQIPFGHPAQANLSSALKHLGIDRPGDVGLSNSVLTHESGTVVDFNKYLEDITDPRD